MQLLLFSQLKLILFIAVICLIQCLIQVSHFTRILASRVQMATCTQDLTQEINNLLTFEGYDSQYRYFQNHIPVENHQREGLNFSAHSQVKKAIDGLKYVSLATDSMKILVRCPSRETFVITMMKLNFKIQSAGLRDVVSIA